ncbi:cell cycle checkpoint protein [Fistulifera solaris]|uniref:Cell cycle checkpoint protein n=1 Tax=Fistulifera solaris TaxID=1519565 RepID=A0A1Z5K4W8_FISSO|nr:cell cycle checkpoint protein [Fistulifera solaris]|eukprot:GAX21300.1 cell cycle checkpoint protein [Fistulifera solaris]
MSKPPSRRRSRGQGPLRLSWPTTQQSQTATSQTAHENTKRTRSLWSDEYAPTSINDLCVAPKKVKEVTAWLDQSNSKLLILVGSPGIGKSTMIHLLLKERNLKVLEWNESFSSLNMNGSSRNGSTLSSIEYQSPVDSFHQFLEEAGTGYHPISISGETDSRSTAILLDDLPYLHTAETQARFRRLFQQHLEQSRIPTILIMSDVTEGKCQHLTDYLDNRFLYNSGLVTIIHVNTPTRSRFVSKVVQRVTAFAGINISVGAAEDIYDRVEGDARAALATLQFEYVGRKKGQRTAKFHGGVMRDKKLNTFHALGKLLYAKRQSMSVSPHERPPLEFDPEWVVEQSDSELSNVLAFLGFHSVEFYTDISDFSEATHCLSDAALWLSQSHLTGNYTKHSPSHVFPDAYVTSLAGRTVAWTNQHPAVSRFRQFSAPPIYQVVRKRRDNQNQLDQWRESLLNHGVIHDLANSTAWSTEIVPFARKILPQSMTSSLDDLQSQFRPMEYHPNDVQEAKEAEMQWIEQQTLFQEDDITGYDSDEDNTKFVTTTHSAVATTPTASPTSAIES